ncbi:MAG: hypothetical protein ACKVP5_00105, partial [Aestuariivirga sp.]
MTIPQIENLAAHAIGRRNGAARTAWACGWLEACGYPGLKLLREALSEPAANWQANRDALGLDLANISCVWIGDAVVADV